MYWMPSTAAGETRKAATAPMTVAEVKAATRRITIDSYVKGRIANQSDPGGFRTHLNAA